MSPLFCTALLALCGIGVTIHGHLLQCKSSQKYLVRQQLYINKFQLKFEYNRKWLQQFCMLDVPELPQIEYNPPENLAEKLVPEQSPSQLPLNITIITMYPPGSPCNPLNETGPADAQRPPGREVDPTYQPLPPYPTDNPGGAGDPLWPPYPTGNPNPTDKRPDQGGSCPPCPPCSQPTKPSGSENPWATRPTPGNPWPTRPTPPKSVPPKPNPQPPNPTSSSPSYPDIPQNGKLVIIVECIYNSYPYVNATHPGPSGGPSYPGPDGRPSKPGPSGGPLYPGPGAGPSKPGPSGGPSYPGPSGIPSNPGPSGGPSYPGPGEGPSYPGPSGRPSNPGPSGGPSNPGPNGGPSYPGPGEGPSYPGPSGRPSNPGPSGKPSYPGPDGRPSNPGPSGGPSYPGPAGRPSNPGPNGGPSYPGPSGRPSYPGPSGGPSYPGPGGGPSYPALGVGPSYPGPGGGPSYPGPGGLPLYPNLGPSGGLQYPNHPPIWGSYSQYLNPLIPYGNGFSPRVGIIRLEKIWGTPKDIEDDAKLKTVELVKKYGYPVETHFVLTTDGYKLCLHRIPRPGGKVILLVHGLMSSSATWVQMGPGNGLGFSLYEQGYDVWLLNTRGNIYSQQHKNPNIKPADYWSFSFHEIGIYDLPATINKIMAVTQVTQIQYIGHSQGCTAFFVMCSQLPEYSEKVILMQALSPSVYMQNTESPVLRFLGLFKGKFGVMLNLLGGFKISNDNQLITQFRNHICKEGQMFSQICAIFDFVMCGFGWNQVNTTLTPLIVGHASQGASSYQIYHYAQLISGMKFQAFDRGLIFNMQRYNQPTPPAYNLTQSSCKVAIHHSQDDWLSTSGDVRNLHVALPNVVDNNRITIKGFSHYDYMISQSVHTVVNTRIVSNCRKYSPAIYIHQSF